MTNEKDYNVIHNLFAEFHYADDLGVIKSKLSAYVASVRKEEREAAFKEAADYIREQRFAMNRYVAKRFIDYFEAAASSKGENDGRRATD